MQNRIIALTNLLEYSQPIDALVTSLKSYPWDAERAYIFLTSNHIRNILFRYIKGEISNTHVELWANAIEGREDIDFNPNNDDLLQEILHQLANPLLTEKLTIDVAKNILNNLK